MACGTDDDDKLTIFDIYNEFKLYNIEEYYNDTINKIAFS